MSKVYKNFNDKDVTDLKAKGHTHAHIRELDKMVDHGDPDTYKFKNKGLAEYAGASAAKTDSGKGYKNLTHKEHDRAADRHAYSTAEREE